MRYNQLGQTDINISEICLGTMTFGVQTSEDDAFAQMDLAIENGVNCFDTAELYPVLPISKETQGESERILGRWAQSRQPADLKIFTKIAGINQNSTRENSPISPKEIDRSIERSLNNLQTDCIDLYQLHWPNRPHYHFRRLWNFQVDPAIKAQEVEGLHAILESLGKHISQGHIRAFGVSNDSAWGIMKLLQLSEKYDLPRLASVQNEYSLMHRIYEPDLQEIGVFENISLLTYSSLAGGILSGKYGRDGKTIPPHSRRSIEDNIGGRVNDHIWETVNAYLDIAQKHNISPVQFAYRFCLNQNFLGSIIIGATNISQLQETFASALTPLPDEIMAEIQAVRRKQPIPL